MTGALCTFVVFSVRQTTQFPLGSFISVGREPLTCSRGTVGRALTGVLVQSRFTGAHSIGADAGGSDGTEGWSDTADSPGCCVNGTSSKFRLVNASSAGATREKGKCCIRMQRSRKA